MQHTPRMVVAAAAALALLACGGGDGSQAEVAGNTGATTVVSFEAMNESGMMGSLMLAPGGESVTVKVEVLGLTEGETYPAHLHAGACQEGGDAVRDLEPLTVNSLGIGSSSSQVPRSEIQSGPHFVQVHLPDGTPAACADLP